LSSRVGCSELWVGLGGGCSSELWEGSAGGCGELWVGSAGGCSSELWEGPAGVGCLSVTVACTDYSRALYRAYVNLCVERASHVDACLCPM